MGERFGRGGGFRSYPVEVGKEYEVDISETSQRGEGVARVQGFVVFVPGTKPGEKVKIRITRIGRRSANGEVVK
ncbi:MAG: TRAM domain-containing protein [Candidatus Bathyarchaeia archaeon]